MLGRAFTSPDDFNQQLDAWLPIANARMSTARRRRPNDLFRLDRAAMRALPPTVPEGMFRNRVRLLRDYYVRAFSNDHPVDLAMNGRLVEVSARLDTVALHQDVVLIAQRRRKWAKQLTVTDPAHVARAAELRAQFEAQHARRPAVVRVVEMASLAHYDDLVSIDLATAPTPLAVA